MEFSKFQRFNEVYYSFTLCRNGFSQEFCSKERTIILSWIDELCNYVCRTDYVDTYQYVTKLGQGNFAEVHKVQNIITGKLYAAKIFYKEKIST